MRADATSAPTEREPDVSETIVWRRTYGGRVAHAVTDDDLTTWRENPGPTRSLVALCGVQVMPVNMNPGTRHCANCEARATEATP